MKNILSYKTTLTIFAVVLTLISIRMHIDPAGITESEFPYAQGDAFDIAVTIRHLIASLLFVIASITFFCRKSRGYKVTAVSSQRMHSGICRYVYHTWNSDSHRSRGTYWRNHSVCCIDCTFPL